MQRITTKPFGDLSALELHRIVRAREAVFFLEQHVSCPDADDTDLQSTFLWIEDADRVVAFLRIIPPCVVYAEASIGRVLVDAAYRRKGLCRRLMHAALDHIASAWGPQAVRISAQSYLTEFYRSLGFEVVSEEYLEAGIPHVKMLRL